MPLTIRTIDKEPGDPVFYEEDFRTLIENHMLYIRTYQGTTTTGIPGSECVRFIGDFYGLLKNRGYAPEKHYLMMRVNGFNSSSDFGMDEERFRINEQTNFQLVIPNESIIQNFVDQYKVSRKK